MKKLLILLGLSIPFVLFSLSIEKGNLRVVVNDETGGYICYGRVSESDGWYPLYVESFTSSYLQVSVGGDTHLLSGNKNYHMSLQSGEEWVAISYEDAQVRVEERVELITSSESGMGHINVEIVVNNRTDETLDIGIKRVLDTNLIRGDSHFTIDGISIESEVAFEEGSIPALIQGTSATGIERLYVQPYATSSDKAPLPNRLLLANWNRIDTLEWDYTPAEGTNFNALPFSINDSAIGLYWLPVPVRSENSLYASFALSVTDFSVREVVALEEEQAAQVIYTGMDPDLVDLFMDEQIDYIDRLVQDIDRLIASGQGIGNSDILNIENRLAILKEKKRDYEELQ